MPKNLKVKVLFGTAVVAAIIVIILIPPESIARYLETDTVEFVNGATAVMAILMAFGSVLHLLAFYELRQEAPKFKKQHFQALGLFIIPFIEAFISYILLASEAPEYAVKLSLVSFLTALLLIGTYFLTVYGKIKEQQLKSQ